MYKRQKIRKLFLLFSFLLFPITIFYFSPVLIIMGAYKGIIVGSFIVFICMFLCSLFLGRIFCGWGCPTGGLEEIAFIINDKPLKKLSWLRYLIWVPWIVSIIVLFFNAGGIKSIKPLFNIPYGISLSVIYSFIVYYFVILLVFLLSIVFGKRAFCHYLCWVAPFMIIGRKIRNIIKWPSLRLSATNNDCIHCHLCIKNCPMSLDVENMVTENKFEHSDCILCGACVDNCNKNVIKFDF